MGSFVLKRSKYWYYDDKLKAYIAEKHPSARFIEEICLRTKNGGYSENPGIVLYEETPPNGFTNKFFAYYKYIDREAMLTGGEDRGQWVITGLSNFDPVVEGILVPDKSGGGVLAISRYCHDFFQLPDGSFVDGGRDYTRTGGSVLPTIVRIDLFKKKFQVEKDGDWNDYTD